MSSEPDKKVAWQEALKVSLSMSIPALILMVVSFFLFNPALVSLLTDLRREQVEKEVKRQVGEEIKKQAQEEAKIQVAQERAKILDGQKALLKLDKESPLGRTYVSGEINKQAKEQAQKAAKDEIGQAKGDLFGQITFPVIFAIASIFAAFAVKDILTEVLKEQERNRIKRDIETNLRTDLISQIVPEAVAEKKQKINERLDDIEGYAYWLEHQILNIFINQAIGELNESSIPSQNEPKLLLAIEKLNNRSIVTLEKASGNFRRKYFVDIKKFEESTLQIKLDSVKLSAKESTQQKQAIILAFDESDKRKNEREVYKGQSLFQTQMGLLRIALNRLTVEDGCSIERKKLLDELDENIAKDPREQYQKNTEINAKREEESQVKPREW